MLEDEREKRWSHLCLSFGSPRTCFNIPQSLYLYLLQTQENDIVKVWKRGRKDGEERLERRWVGSGVNGGVMREKKRGIEERGRESVCEDQ